MNAGNLRHYAQIKRLMRGEGFGGKDSYVHYAYIWCSIKPLSGTERLEAAQNNHQVTHEIRTRFIQGLLPSMRIYCNGKTYRIVYILDLAERQKEFKIQAEEVIDRA